MYRKAYKSSIFYIQHDALYIDSIKKTYTFLTKVQHIGRNKNMNENAIN